MQDRILELGSAGLDTTDQKVRKMMDNIVNSEVPGYKKSDVVVSSFPQVLEDATHRAASLKPQVENTYYNYLQGALIKSNSSLDLALGSDGFFVVYGSWGEGYTRDGRFQLDDQGRLLTIAGALPVAGQNGPIVVSQGAKVSFDQQGNVMVDNEAVDRIRVVKPDNVQAMESINGSIFKLGSSAGNLSDVADPRVLQGYIEASNVDVIDQYMQMIMLERQYNIDTKIVSTRDSMLGKAMEMGRANQ